MVEPKSLVKVIYLNVNVVTTFLNKFFKFLYYEERLFIFTTIQNFNMMLILIDREPHFLKYEFCNA